MSIASPIRISLSVALISITLSLASGFSADGNKPRNEAIAEFGSDSARLATFDSATGETAFALSINPQIDDQKQWASDVVIYIDTSASQSGLYRKDSILTLRRILVNLNSEDRVKLIAIDIEPVDLTAAFVAPNSDEINVALEKLRKRVPLGATDMPRMFEHLTTLFESDATRNRNVIYIGDGVSRGQFLTSKKFPVLISKLVENRISFSSFVIGPERDIETLSVVANQTGGNIYLDSDEKRSITDGAKGLASTVHGMVFWPTEFQLPTTVAEIYPTTIPPLRTDRDSVLIGTLKDRSDIEFSINGELAGKPTAMNWLVAVEQPNPDFAFLPKLVSEARKNDGTTLPTVGSAGLREMARVLLAQSSQLTRLGNQAMVRGDYSSATTLGEAALGSDPISAEAEALLNKAKQDDDDPFGDDDPADGGEDQDDAAGGDSDPFADDDGDQDPAGNDPFGDGNANDNGNSPDAGADPAAKDPMAEDPFADQSEGSEGASMNDVAPAKVPSESANSDVLQGSDPLTDGSDSKLEGSGRPALPNQLQPGQTIDDAVDSGALRMINPNATVPQARDEIDELLQQSASQSGTLISNEQELNRVLTERLRVRVRVEMERAREEIISGAPGDAVDRLKSMLEVMDQVSSIEAGVKADLRLRLLAELNSARREKLEYDDAVARAQENAAIALELEAARVDYVNREVELAALINRFDSLLKEGQFAAAEAVTTEAVRLAPESPPANLAFESSRIISNIERNHALRQVRQTAFLDTLYQSELSATPFSGDPPLVFGDAAEWQRKKQRREKYQNVRFAGNESEEVILRELEKPADMDYVDTPFVEVMDELRDQYGINVRLDESARADLDEDTLINFNVKGIRLKNALRLMLNANNATFIVQDEVLKIISLDVAGDPEFFVRNIYNVGDLVAPRIPIGGIGGGGGGGFGGGGGQQGGGGFGGGGGQQGGGGFGGGGGGGVFCIVDSIDDQTDAPTDVVSKRINSPDGETPLDAWSDYFADNHPAPARVRETVRQLMQEKQTEQVTGLILGAIQNSQSQPWMYEALVLALQIGNQPESEIARALASAVDLSQDQNDLMIAAKYMIDSGLEKRAIDLLKQVCDFETNTPEAFVLALSAAQKIHDIEGIKWATLGILNQAWPTHRHVVKKAMTAAAGLKIDLQKQGLTAEADAYGRQLDEAYYRDCVIKVSWTGDADVDIFVEEPGGTICSRRNQRTTAGGIMMGDAYSTDPDQSGEWTEYYVLPRGFSGDYRLMIRKVWGDVTANKVTVAIYNHFRTDKQTSEQRQINLGEQGSLVLFQLADGRRTKSLEEHTIETMADQEFFVSREVLARQFSENYSSETASDYYGSRNGSNPSGFEGAVINSDDVERLIDLPRAVGYRPEITQLFEGAFMTASATTADRLYVLVNVSPTFNQITDVNTFNILGNADTAGGAGGGLGGAGGGLGGAGGGGGGGGGIGGGLF